MNDELQALGRMRTRGLLVLAAVAIAAGAVGAAIERVWITREVAGAAQNVGWAVTGSGRDEEVAGKRTAAGMMVRSSTDGIPISLRAIDLTDEQKARIRKVTERFQPTADSLMRDVLPRVRDIDLQMRQLAMCVLTPKQREDWVAWRRRERMNVEEGTAFLKLVNSNSCPKDISAP